MDKAEYCRQWRRKNRDSYRAKKRANYEKNKTVIRERMREYYHRVCRPDRLSNPEKYKIRDREWAKKRREKFRVLFLELKEAMGNKCSRCSYCKHPKILHFHHLRNKAANVSELKSIRKIKEEAKKCILLCPNCHMEITFAGEI